MNEERTPTSVDLEAIADSLPKRIELDPESARRDLGHLVLTLVEVIREVVEHQAVQRMDDGDLDDARIERMGEALMELDRTMTELCEVFGLRREDLGVDLGPLRVE